MDGCEKCGRLDSSLRGASFMYVVSLIFVTMRQPGAAGVFCSRCRKWQAFKDSLVSALLGWWGFPWGPLYTLQVIGRNSAGGYQDREFNASLLVAVGAELAEQGDNAEAVKALEKSLSLSDVPEVRQFLWSLQGSGTGLEAPVQSDPVAVLGSPSDQPAPESDGAASSGPAI